MDSEPAVDVLVDESLVDRYVLDEGAEEDRGGEVRGHLPSIDGGGEFAALDAALDGGDGELLPTTEESRVEFGDGGVTVRFDDERHRHLAEFVGGEEFYKFANKDDQV